MILLSSTVKLGLSKILTYAQLTPDALELLEAHGRVWV